MPSAGCLCSDPEKAGDDSIWQLHGGVGADRGHVDVAGQALHVDPATAERVIDLLAAQVRLEGAACVLVTHSRMAAARADRTLTLTSDGIVAG